MRLCQFVRKCFLALFLFVQTSDYGSKARIAYRAPHETIQYMNIPNPGQLKIEHQFSTKSTSMKNTKKEKFIVNSVDMIEFDFFDLVFFFYSFV